MTGISSEKGTWLLFVPVNNVLLGSGKYAEFQIHRVLLCGSAKISRIRNRIGLPFRLSELSKKHGDIQANFFGKHQTFALMRLTGISDETKKQFLKTLREELAILSLSQLGFGRRRYNAAPSVAIESPGGPTLYFMVNTGNKNWRYGGETNVKHGRMGIEKSWHDRQRKGFFIDLLNIIRGKTKVSSVWRKTLRDAAILAGQSQMSNDLPQAFLWNMIAIEMLLTKQGDHYSDTLPERAETFLGWTIQWYEYCYEDKVRDVYKKRCGMVHSGERDEITIEDLLFSDTLLLNVITNIVKHPRLFKSKEALIDYSKRIQAENLLGIRSKNRPKTFRCAIPVYTGNDLTEI